MLKEEGSARLGAEVKKWDRACYRTEGRIGKCAIAINFPLRKLTEGLRRRVGWWREWPLSRRPPGWEMGVERTRPEWVLDGTSGIMGTRGCP